MSILSDIVFKLGGQSATARLLGTKQQNVKYHMDNNTMPTEWVLALSDATGIPCWEIRPDIYPEELFKKAA